MSGQSIQFNCPNPEDLEVVYQKLVPQFSGLDLLLLSGVMGAGKTTFIKGLVGYLLQTNLNDSEVHSPTFGIHNEYSGPGDLPIHHFDLHRIETNLELENTGFWEAFEAPKGLICVEWPPEWESSNWPPRWQQLHLKIEIQEDSRRITLD